MTIRYAIRPAHPGAHLFQVTVTVDTPDPEGQRFTLPAWIPGSYLIREFARSIVRLTALAGDRKVKVKKLDKHTWQCGRVAGPLTLAYEVYAWDLSVRAAHLDRTHAFFNGTSVFLLPSAREHERCEVDILPPEGRAYSEWKIATGLAPARGTKRGGFGTYVARDYDELIDSPVELGTFTSANFDVLGVPHEIAVTGRVPNLDLRRLTADLATVCAAQIRLFEPRTRKAPFERYTFLVQAVDDLRGGLEHRNSTALICKRGSLPFVGMNESTDAYRDFLGLASHEYFHSWNVKRIRPAAFIPYDLARENYTRLLWVFEGLTSYYDDLMLRRAGLLTDAQYFDLLAQTMTTVMQRSGRLKQSVAQSSFDAWIKYYRQDENAPNSVVSYYQKGALIGLALDLTVRMSTHGARSLDDVMRLLWLQWRNSPQSYRGIEEDEFIQIAENATDLKLARAIRAWTEGAHDPDFAALLAPFGIALERASTDQLQHALLGIKVADGSECRIAHVFDGSPAQTAGLSGNDVLIAVDGLRVTAANLESLLGRYRPNDIVELTAFRRDELMRFDLTLGDRPPPRFALNAASKPTSAALKLRRGWLGEAHRQRGAR
jgi:predicted metalloprotease with PDZ domain